MLPFDFIHTIQMYTSTGSAELVADVLAVQWVKQSTACIFLAVFIALFFPRETKTQWFWRCFKIIAAVEIIQGVAAVGAFDVDDFMINGIGVYIGLALFSIIRKRISTNPKYLQVTK